MDAAVSLFDVLLSLFDVLLSLFDVLLSLFGVLLVSVVGVPVSDVAPSGFLADEFVEGSDFPFWA